jgi:zinc transport system substrate-binding protein
MIRLKSPIAGFTLGLILSSLLLGCVKKPAEKKDFRVLCTVFPMYVFTRNIVGSVPGTSVELMLPASLGCPHDYSLTPGDMEKIMGADVLVVNGMGLEAFLAKPALGANPRLKVIDASYGIDPIADSHGTNPHVWVSLSDAFAQVRNIAFGLAELDPRNAAQYKKNGAAYAAEFMVLRMEFLLALKDAPVKRIVTFHDAFAYFARDLGLEVAAVIEETPGQEPSAGDLARLARKLKEARPIGIFAEPQYPEKIADVLSRESGVPVYVLDPVASGEMTPTAYMDGMRKNLETLKKALAAGGK